MFAKVTATPSGSGVERHAIANTTAAANNRRVIITIERQGFAPTALRRHDLPTLRLDGGGWMLLGERQRDQIAFGRSG